MEDKNLQNNSDLIGMISSGLCLIHCLAMPFVLGWYTFSEHAHHDHVGHVHAHASVGGFNWDYFFILLALVAVLFSTRGHAASTLVKSLLWVFFAMFAIGIGFEAFGVFFQILGYTASLGLIATHWINYRECRNHSHA
ncbi:MAG: MerC domain-containing protein [Saprospiraceae bacterium]